MKAACVAKDKSRTGKNFGVKGAGGGRRIRRNTGFPKGKLVNRIVGASPVRGVAARNRNVIFGTTGGKNDFSTRIWVERCSAGRNRTLKGGTRDRMVRVGLWQGWFGGNAGESAAEVAGRNTFSSEFSGERKKVRGHPDDRHAVQKGSVKPKGGNRVREKDY